MPRLLREPLVHFLVLGAVLFAAGAALEPAATPARREQLHVGEGEVRWLTETWTRQWQRQPTDDEVRGLVADWLKEEILAREARSQGLDQDDAIVRRRLAQKLEYLAQDSVRLAEPDDETLRRLHEARPERFGGEPRWSFSHVYFARERRAEAAAALERLAAGADPLAQGDPLLVDPDIDRATHRDVVAMFGPGFADAVAALAPGGWHGPIESGYGLHLVRVRSRDAGEPRPFEAARDAVLELWREERRQEVVRDLVGRLAERIEVVVDPAVRRFVEVPGRAEPRR